MMLKDTTMVQLKRVSVRFLGRSINERKLYCRPKEVRMGMNQFTDMVGNLKRTKKRMK